MESGRRPIERRLPYETNAEVSTTREIKRHGCSSGSRRVFDTVYTPTADFVLSASDDGNVRIWKNNASAKLGPMDTRERQQMEYRKKLREKWAGESSVRKIERYVTWMA